MRSSRVVSHGADLLQQARQIEVVMRLADALPVNLEHLGGFEADPAIGGGDVAGWHVEGPGLSALPCDFERNGAVVSHRALDPPRGIGECFLPTTVGFHDRFLAFQMAVSSQFVVYTFVGKRCRQALPVADVKRFDVCASYIGRGHSHSPLECCRRSRSQPSTWEPLPASNLGCAKVELVGSPGSHRRCGAWLRSVRDAQHG